MARDAVATLEKGYRVDVTVGPHRLVGDELPADGGTDAGPSPFEYLSMALACCTSITLQMYAQRKKWPLERVEVKVRHFKREDADFMDRELRLLGALDGEQRSRLVDIANKCPVHKALTNKVTIVTQLL